MSSSSDSITAQTAAPASAGAASSRGLFQALRGVRVLLGTQIKGASGKEILLHNAAGEPRIDAGAAVIEAIGPQPERGIVPILDSIAVPYVLVGDCLQTGDFMTAIRDGFMVGWSTSTRFGRAANH